MSTATDPTNYRWGDDMRPELRQRLIDEIAESGEREETVDELKEKSNADLFLIWLRS